MEEDDVKLQRRSSERLRYAVDVAHKLVNYAYTVFAAGKKPYHHLFIDVCQDINAQLDTLTLLIKHVAGVAAKYDYKDCEANGYRSLLAIVDCALKELIVHVKYCVEKHSSFFFNGTNAANKLSSICILLAKLAKLLDIATLMDKEMDGKCEFLELNNPVGKVCAQELDDLHRECFYGQLAGFQFAPSLQRVMKGVCVALTSYSIGYYYDIPSALQPDNKSFFWKSSASIVGGAKYWFKEEERAQKFVELTHKCASIAFTKSFWNLLETGIIAEVPKLVNKKIDVAVEIFIAGEPIYVRNKFDEMILIHPPVGKQGSVGVTVGCLSSKLRDGQLCAATQPHRAPKCDRLLVHFHGGGFVAGSHTYHQTYLRAWCCDLDMVVVSVNYSLAPENPFPKGLDDCVFAYAWCLENLHTLGCTGKSILFMGDSAGGNLAISTAMRANSYGLRPPDAILACYPVTYVKYSASASRLLSALDILLPSGVLQCCVRAYTGVPVDSNTSFYQWLRSADKPATEESSPNLPREEITEGNSKYITDISLPTEGTNNPLHSSAVSSSTELSAANSLEDLAPTHRNQTIELDTIRINPIVFDNNTAADNTLHGKVIDNDSNANTVQCLSTVTTESENKFQELSQENPLECGRPTNNINNLTEVKKDIRDDFKKDLNSKEDISKVGISKDEISKEDISEGNTTSTHPALTRLFPTSENLEQMLYEDSGTRFKAAKLVLTPVKETQLCNDNLLGKKATVIHDNKRYTDKTELHHVINPGEIATRRNMTLLQKYFDDPFLSPFLADDNTLKMLPPVHIVAAEFDPLLDDSVAFCRKMERAGGRVKLDVIPGMTHGFLNLILSSNLCASAANLCFDILNKQFLQSEK